SALEVDYVRIYQKGIIPPSNTQTITFPPLPDKLISSPPFQLVATASSNLPVQYSTTSDKIIISGSTATIVGKGRVTIKANQPGNGIISAAPEVSQSFCIRPIQPLVTSSNLNTDRVILTSNATTGNQWYVNGVAIPSATNSTLSVTTSGVYQVQVVVDDCASEFSADVPIVITGDLNRVIDTLHVYPNPFMDYLELRGISGVLTSVELIDLVGRKNTIHFERLGEVFHANVSYLTLGVYVLQVQDGNQLYRIKVIKK
ncbi:MAG: T9SS type A sorting domain-containing protein, partial [Flammeovirgaceae bacterium]